MMILGLSCNRKRAKRLSVTALWDLCGPSFSTKDAKRVSVNTCKLKQGRVRPGLRKDFSSVRTIRQWQRLPRADYKVSTLQGFEDLPGYKYLYV